MSQQDKYTNAATRAEGEGAPKTPQGQGEKTEVPLVEHDNLQSVQRELEQALAKAEENWDLYLKTRAEMENIRKRSERDLQNAHKFALEKFIGELLPVRDSLEMGISAAKETKDIAKLLEGSELTLRMLSMALEKYGVQEINPQGEKFNPELHEAMAMQPSAEVEPNTVLHVIQKGYLLNGRLIRPAMVIVAQAAKPDSGLEKPKNTPK